jgi:hypothetical protein
MWVSNRWLNFRLQLTGAVVSGGAAWLVVRSAVDDLRNALVHPLTSPTPLPLSLPCLSLSQVRSADRIGSTAAGLALVYSMYFTQNLTFLTRAHSDCQVFNYSTVR